MSEDRLDILFAKLKVALRSGGRANIETWLQNYDSGSGDVLMLKAPTPGHKIIETGFQTSTWSA